MPKGRAIAGMRMFRDAVADPCKGHECDHCEVCQRGRCCRNDYPQYQLPEEGSWDGPIFGRTGVLNEDGTKMECHICGQWFRIVGIHAWAAHGVTPAEYRAYFGLKSETGLCSSLISDRLAEAATERYETHPLVPPQMTPEQRSLFRKGRRQRREFFQSSGYERLRESNRQHAEKRHDEALVETPCVICGNPVVRQSSLVTSRSVGVVCSDTCLGTLRSQLNSQRTHSEESKRRLSEAKKGRLTAAMRTAHERLRKPVEKVCPQCGNTFSRKASQARRDTYCSVACWSASRTVEKACETCGKIVRVYKTREAEFRFCSRACQTGFYQLSDHCKNGHTWTPETTTLDFRGAKHCTICRREAQRRYNASRQKSSAI